MLRSLVGSEMCIRDRDMPFPKTHRPDSLSPIAPKDFDLHKVGIVKG